MAKRGKPAFNVSKNAMPAGMECDSDSEDSDFLYDGTPKRGSPRHPFGGNQRKNEQNGAPNGVHSQLSNGDRHERTLFNADRDSGGENPNHWRTHRMHRGLAVPKDEFRQSVMQGNMEMVKSLVDQGIDVDIILQAGWTALMYACSGAHPEITHYLLEQKADVSYHKERFTSLMAACAASRDESSMLQCVKHLVEHGCDVNAMEKHHFTALMFAARGGRSTIVAYLVENGAKVDLCDNRNWTALMLAISSGHGAVVRILIEANASIDNVKSSGQTMVELALEHGHDSIAQLLQTFTASKTFPDMELLNQPVSNSAEAEPFKDKRRVKSAPCGDLEFFLTSLALSELIPVFHLQDLSFQQFLRLTDDELIKIGVVKLGARKTILEGIRDVHRVDWKNSSLASLNDLTISCPDAVSMVANISKHLSYIQSTIGYLRDQIQTTPRILELGQDVNSVRTLIQRLEDAIKNNKNLQEELRFLKLHLNKVQDNVEYVPADLIVERRASDSDIDDRRQRRNSVLRITAIVAIVSVAIVTTGAWKKPSIVSGRLIAWWL